jgi:hypothetical protein
MNDMKDERQKLFTEKHAADFLTTKQSDVRLNN